MSHALWIAIIMFLVADAFVFAIIVRGKLASSGIKLSTLRAVSQEVHQQVGAYVPVNYSGRPEDLPQLIDALLPQAAQIAVGKGQILDQTTIELLVTTSLVAHHAATRAQVDVALRQLHATRESRRAA